MSNFGDPLRYHTSKLWRYNYELMCEVRIAGSILREGVNGQNFTIRCILPKKKLLLQKIVQMKNVFEFNYYLYKLRDKTA